MTEITPQATLGTRTSSNLLDGSISHDAVTRFLSQPEFTSKDLWKQVKTTVREVESEAGVLIFDDTTQEKPHMDENDLICCGMCQPVLIHPSLS